MNEGPEITQQIDKPPVPSQPEEPLPDSRLKEHVKKQTIRNVLLVLSGFIILGIVLIVFGAQLLIGFSMLLGGTSSKQQQVESKTNNPAYIAPPVLDPMEDATKSASVTVSGYTTNAEQSINLYVNGKLVKKAQSKSNKNFTIRNVPLKEGKNEIKAKTIKNEHQSVYSNRIAITYTTKAPELTIENPQEGQTFKKDQSPIEVRGKTDPGTNVTVNDFWAIVESTGEYSYNYTLQDGENKIKVIATDEAENKTEKEITIKVE